MSETNEMQIKQRRLAEFLERHRLDGAYFQRRNNFAWITGGRDNHVASFSPAGVAGILATKDGRRVCFTNTIEAPRFSKEELAGSGIEVVDFLWHDSGAGTKVLRELVAGQKIAADVSDSGQFNHFDAGLSRLPDDFAELRWSLTDEEIARYRDGARRTSAAIEKACRQLKPGMTEHEIAGVLDHEIHASGGNPVVTLIASDERVMQFRHPIPTGKKARKYVMLVTCAENSGMISNITRFVSFAPLSDEIRKKQQAVCNVDATVNLYTKPGKTLGEMFAVIQKAYADNGFPGEEKLHHQGGSTGYDGREVFASPTTPTRVLDKQAFAWNPSITGTKCEDTILVLGDKIEVLTAHSKTWPTVIGHAPDGRTLDRADILVL